MKRAAAVPPAMVRLISPSKLPLIRESRIWPRRLRSERRWKRSSSRDSWPKAWTRRSAVSVSCTPLMVSLSMALTWDHSRLMRARKTWVRPSISGATVRATSASCQSIWAVTQVMATTVRIEVTKGITPWTATHWMAGASYWIRYRELVVPWRSW